VPQSPSFADLIRLLDAGTERGQLTWEEDGDEDTFRTKLAQGSVRLSKSGYRGTVFIELLDQKGKEVRQYEAAGAEEERAAKGLLAKVRLKALNLEDVEEWLVGELRQRAGER
jgi:hypothetical protein